MEVRYRNNTDKLVYLGIPIVFFILGSITGNFLLIILATTITLAISSVIIPYIVKYYRKTIVISIKNKELNINSNGSYKIPLKSITNVYLRNNGKSNKQVLYIDYVKKDIKRNLYLSDLYDVSLEVILKKLKNKIK